MSIQDNHSSRPSLPSHTCHTTQSMITCKSRQNTPSIQPPHPTPPSHSCNSIHSTQSNHSIQSIMPRPTHTSHARKLCHFSHSSLPSQYCKPGRHIYSKSIHPNRNSMRNNTSIPFHPSEPGLSRHSSLPSMYRTPSRDS